MSTGDTFWDEMRESMLHVPDRDPVLPDELIDQILRGQPVEVGTAPGGLALAELVTTLREPARPVELRGEARAAAAHRWEMKTRALKEQRHRRLRPSVSARIAAAAFVGSLGMGGIAAAAADGSLPAPLQHLAHVFFGAPPAHADGQRGDDATGGAGPVPMSTDTSTPTPLESPGTSTSGVPADTAFDRCAQGMAAAQFCDDIVEPGREPEIGEPGTNPTTDSTASSATDSTSPEVAEAAPPPAHGHPAGAPPAPPAGSPAPPAVPAPLAQSGGSPAPPAPPAVPAPPAPPAVPVPQAPPALQAPQAPPAPPAPAVEQPATDHLTGTANSP